MTVGITELPPEGMQLGGVALAGDAERGTKTTEGLSLLFTTAGITVQGPQPQIERLLVWSGLDSATCREKVVLPDGRNAAVMELTSGGQSIRFLFPTETVTPGQAAYLDQALPHWLARYKGAPPAPATVNGSGDVEGAPASGAPANGNGNGNGTPPPPLAAEQPSGLAPAAAAGAGLAAGVGGALAPLLGRRIWPQRRVRLGRRRWISPHPHPHLPHWPHPHPHRHPHPQPAPPAPPHRPHRRPLPHYPLRPPATPERRHLRHLRRRWPGRARAGWPRPTHRPKTRRGPVRRSTPTSPPRPSVPVAAGSRRRRPPPRWRALSIPRGPRTIRPSTQCPWVRPRCRRPHRIPPARWCGSPRSTRSPVPPSGRARPPPTWPRPSWPPRPRGRAKRKADKAAKAAAAASAAAMAGAVALDATPAPPWPWTRGRSGRPRHPGRPSDRPRPPGFGAPADPNPTTSQFDSLAGGPAAGDPGTALATETPKDKPPARNTRLLVVLFVALLVVIAAIVYFVVKKNNNTTTTTTTAPGLSAAAQDAALAATVNLHQTDLPAGWVPSSTTGQPARPPVAPAAAQSQATSALAQCLGVQHGHGLGPVRRNGPARPVGLRPPPRCSRARPTPPSGCTPRPGS